MNARLIPAVRQKLVEVNRLLDRAQEAGEDTDELRHVLKTLLLQRVEFGRESLSGLLALAADAAVTLESGKLSDDDARMAFETLDSWFREVAIVMASLRASRHE